MVNTRSKSNSIETKKIEIEKKASKIVKKFKNKKVTGEDALKIVQKLDFDLKSFLTSQNWKEYLNDEFDKEYFKQLNEALNVAYKKETIYPPKELIFNAFNLTELENVFNIYIKKMNSLKFYI